MPERTRIQLLAPVVRGRKGEHQKLFERAKKSGYVRVIVDGSMYELSEDIPMEKNIKHNIDIVVDRLVVKPGIEKRLTDSLENVFELTEGNAIVDIVDGEQMTFSQNFACPDCGISIDEVEPRSFSFNNPFGACPTCYGLGYKMEFDPQLMVPDASLSISEGAIQVMGWQSCTDPKSYTYATLRAHSAPGHLHPEFLRDLPVCGCALPESLHCRRSDRNYAFQLPFSLIFSKTFSLSSQLQYIDKKGNYKAVDKIRK